MMETAEVIARSLVDLFSAGWDWTRLAQDVAAVGVTVPVVTWLARQPRLRIVLLKENGDDTLIIEVENVGYRPTSLRRKIRSSFWYPSDQRLRFGRAIYYLKDQDRSVMPFKPRRFTAVPTKLPDSFHFSWFRTYRLAFTTPLPVTGAVARVGDALLKPLTLAAFYRQLGRFLIKGELSVSSSMTLSEYEDLLHSRGVF